MSRIEIFTLIKNINNSKFNHRHKTCERNRVDPRTWDRYLDNKYPHLSQEERVLLEEEQNMRSRDFEKQGTAFLVQYFKNNIATKDNIVIAGKLFFNCLEKIADTSKNNKRRTMVQSIGNDECCVIRVLQCYTCVDIITFSVSLDGKVIIKSDTDDDIICDVKNFVTTKYARKWLYSYWNHDVLEICSTQKLRQQENKLKIV